MPEELRCGSGLIPGGTKDRPFTYDIKKVRGGGTMALVVMDAGHGGNNPGAVYQGRQEKDDALALTLAVGQILEESGVEVYYTRTTDIYEAPERCGGIISCPSIATPVPIPTSIRGLMLL